MTVGSEVCQKCGVSLRRSDDLPKKYGKLVPGTLVLIAMVRQPGVIGKRASEHQLLGRFCPECAPVVGDFLQDLGCTLSFIRSVGPTELP